MHEEGNFRAIQRVQDADLLPRQFDPVGTDAFPWRCLPSKPLLDWADVIDGEHPAEPSAAMLGPKVGLARARLPELAEAYSKLQSFSVQRQDVFLRACFEDMGVR